MLVAGRAPVSSLTVFIGVLGGISAFGAIGLFLGPVVLSLIIALLQFAIELRAPSQDVSERAAHSDPAEPPRALAGAARRCAIA